MSHNIGTNFSYKAENFLDYRQGHANSKEDLKNWNVPVPVGFEVCVNNEWYYYDPNFNNSETGHWIKRVISSFDDTIDPSNQAASMSIISDINEDVERLNIETRKLDEKLNPTKITLNIGHALTSTSSSSDAIDIEINSFINNYNINYDFDGNGQINDEDKTALKSLLRNSIKLAAGTTTSYTVEFGTWVLPKITVSKIEKNDKSLDLETEVKSINVIGGDGQSSISNNKFTWISNTPLPTNALTNTSYTYKVNANIDDNIITSDFTCSINFRYKLYWRVSDINLWEIGTFDFSNNTGGFSSEFVTTGAMSPKHFNCSGEGGATKYPYILTPSALYDNGNYRTYVADNLNSDFQSKRVSVINSNNVQLDYTLLRTTYPQTGSNIKIEIKS